MRPLRLHIGHPNYSSWSLRIWLMLRVAGIPFEEIKHRFFHDDSLRKVAQRLSTPAKVPIIENGEQCIWDSLAIMEWLAENYSSYPFWPSDSAKRAFARSMCAEMHSSFLAIRSQCPMNVSECRHIESDEALEADRMRIMQLFELATKYHQGGTFLLGEFGILDAMYAPVLFRIRNYGLPMNDEFSHWLEAMLGLPELQEWIRRSYSDERLKAYSQVGTLIRDAGLLK